MVGAAPTGDAELNLTDQQFIAYYGAPFIRGFTVCLTQSRADDHVNPPPPGRHFADDIFRYIFVNEKFYILMELSLKFVHKGPIDNNPALIQMMAWCRMGDKPLFVPMLARFTDAYMRH